MAKGKPQPKRISLGEFLKSHTDETAGQLRAVASRIDELQRQTAIYEDAERTMLPVLLLGGAMTLAGISVIVSGDEIYRIVENIFGKVGITVLLAGLPVALTLYGMKVVPRSRADAEKMDLNKAHFLPLGAIYFPAANDQEPTVMVVSEIDHKPLSKSRFDHVTPGRIW